MSSVVSNYKLLLVVPHHPPLTLSLCVSLSEIGISGSEWVAGRATVNANQGAREEGVIHFLHYNIEHRQKKEKKYLGFPVNLSGMQ